ncbi:MAG: SusC/RagA family TonB-linked outer membrane protein [Bacteroidetes bacterium]|nr:SusC/RagA family TonB-linked outer membrane protein [Bacteroidota bacterium]
MNKVYLKLKTVALCYCLLGLIIGVFTPSGLWAQKEVTGKVIDENGDPLIGVTIEVVGTNKGVITDVQGIYSIAQVEDSDFLRASYVGYKSIEKKVGDRDVVNFDLRSGLTLDGVTVTALGVKRETKALGYATQKLDNSEIAAIKTPNLLDNLTGKVAGVNITQGGSGVGSSSRIVIRGESSLSGDNQPLFVVNGIPINNSNGSNGRSQGNLETDFGNGAADINPDDIESVTVLRGANATALYGSRAANGVILITTKTGKNVDGVQVDFNTTNTFETPLRIPQYQNKYGQGAGGKFEFVDGSGSGLNDNIDESWGPPLDGRLMVQHNSRNPEGIRAGDFRLRPNDFSDQGTFEQLPWNPQPNNISNFFQTGFTTNNSLAISAGTEKSNLRFSYSNVYSEGILPNTNLKRNGLNIDVGQKLFNDRVTVNANLNYINSGSDNRPNNSYGTENIMYLWVWFGRHIPMSTLEDYWQPGLENIQQFNYNYNWHDNPYFTMFENTNAFNKNRVLGNVNVNIDIAKNLSLMLRAGGDVFNDLRMGKRAWSSQRYPLGQYREDRIYFEEFNTDFLLSYNTNISDNLSLSVSGGGNQMRQTNRFNQMSANELAVPNIYSFNNSNIPVVQQSFNSERRINSLYANASFGLYNALYLDVSGRNDWASTLPQSNNSYFYPSASLSWIASETFSLPEVVSFAKLRMGYGQVGNDTDPFSLQPYFQFLSQPYGSQLLGTESNVLPNPELRPERLTTFEIGADVRFFGRRLGLDLTYFDNKSVDQIIRIPVSQTSGYGAKFINAGEISTQGFEALVSVVPVKTADFTWEVGANFSINRSTIVKLTDDLETFQLPGNYVSVLAQEGERMGDVYGTGFVVIDPETQERVEINDVEEIKDSYGHLYENGFPVRDPNLRKLGNYNPDFMMGFTNTFTFKNFSLRALVDWRHGGVVFSRTLLIGGTSGMMKETAEYDRETQTFIAGQTKVTGVETLNRTGYKLDEETGQYVENDVAVSARDFYWSQMNRGNEEVGMYDASFVKLRELSLGYALPERLVSRIGLQKLNFSIVGRNLLLFTENPHFDPETFSYNGNQMVPGVEDMATPSTRSIGFSLNVTF